MTETGDRRSVVVLFFTHLGGESCLGVVEAVEYLGVMELGSVVAAAATSTSFSSYT